MATYKVVDADQLNADMTSVADSIRAKGNTTNKLAWPDGYKTAIAAIQTGGGGGGIVPTGTKKIAANGLYDVTEYAAVDVSVPTSGGGSSSVSPKAVNFRDYDGTILYSYTAADALALTEMPPLPTQPGLICQEWNWSFEAMQTYVGKYGKCIVGATYITDDGKTRIYITLSEGRTSPMLGCCPNGTVTVDWGDGTTPDTLTGTSISTVKWTPTHNYAAPGDYVISLTVDGEMDFSGDSASYILRHSNVADGRNIAYANSINKVELGRGITRLGQYEFLGCYGLTSVTIPDSVTSIGDYAFQFCSGLTSVTIPDSVTSIGDEAFMGCSGLTSVTIPDSVTSIGDDAFRECYGLSSVTIPDSVTSIGDYAFQFFDNLTSVTIPGSVTSIGDGAFYYCYGLAKIRFERNTPPTVANANAWLDIPTDCVISVPTGSLSAYTSATNYPDPATYTYIEED